MKLFKITAGLVLMAAVSAIAIAATPTWHTAKITHIYPQADGSIILQFDSDHSSCQSASAPDYYYLTVGQNGLTEKGLERMYSAALTAAAAQKSVTINFDADSSGCYINRLVVNFDD